MRDTSRSHLLIVRPDPAQALETDPMYPLLDADEIADRLSCSRDHVHDLWEQGLLRCIDVGKGKRRMPRARSEDLREFVNERTAG